ncbi:hypothetical protein HHK36_005811 [Tetracentron sinense]|uniref:Uncharacterized protein n=1 Tax=Tetracentron sinense TaxID=13715 RepID=A0A834ZW12_TETSI|nr:hypothetical protein HHK36_005811 [Tetracentron sinense]
MKDSGKIAIVTWNLKQSKTDVPEIKDLKASFPKAKKETKSSLLGISRVWAAPSRIKQQELHTAGHKQRFKQKLKEADRMNAVKICYMCNLYEV